mmetsp:Transcript_79198/g.181302  ORF Transcript_79198/g.181302 Transcript_79198/m.181302 type:complete len:171 (-) Transcript_79198:80-592(-)
MGQLHSGASGEGGVMGLATDGSGLLVPLLVLRVAASWWGWPGGAGHRWQRPPCATAVARGDGLVVGLATDGSGLLVPPPLLLPKATVLWWGWPWMAAASLCQAVQFFSCKNKVTSLLKHIPESLKSEDLLAKVPDGPPLLVEDEGSAGPDFYKMYGLRTKQHLLEKKGKK